MAPTRQLDGVRTAQLAVKQSSRMPLVARSHESIDLDRTRATVAEADCKRRKSLSREQKRRLGVVFFMHLKDLDHWSKTRRVVAFLVKGEKRARWEPSWPRIPWQKVAHGQAFGIYADCVQRVKAYINKYRDRLWAEIKSGLHADLPTWAVRARIDAGQSIHYTPCPLS